MTNSIPAHVSGASDWTALGRRSRRVGRVIEFHPRIGSTNDRAWDLLRDGDGDGAVVVADFQAAGRGRRGRSWVSPAGTNLTVSFALHPRLRAGDAWWLSMAAGVAVREACEPFATLWLSWPNDLVADDGRKVAGVLVETSVEGDRLGAAVLGLGINVNWPRNATELSPELTDRVASLAMLGGAPLDRLALFERLIVSLDEAIIAVEAGSSPLDRYRSAAWLDGRWVSVALPEAEIAGRVAGTDPDGALVLDTPSGRAAVSMGEVVRVTTSRAEPGS